MKSIHNLISERIHANAGLLNGKKTNKHSYDELMKSEWSDEFEYKQRVRLVMGSLRYGSTFKDKRVSKKKWDFIGSIKDKVKLYDKTGNTEYLVDIANYCMLEHDFGTREDKHFSATDDAHHCKVKE